MEEYCEIISGLIISGGDFDIHPKMYQENIRSNRMKFNEKRTNAEIALLEFCMKNNKPILGICGGMQLINVFFGGSLIQDIQEDGYGSQIIHEQEAPKYKPSHYIEITKGTKLQNIVKSEKYMVNSTHHQAVKNIGENLIVSARTQDGIIEAIEYKNCNYLIGVQWHPESCIVAEDKMLIKSFIDACSK